MEKVLNRFNMVREDLLTALKENNKLNFTNASSLKNVNCQLIKQGNFYRKLIDKFNIVIKLVQTCMKNIFLSWHNLI